MGQRKQSAVVRQVEAVIVERYPQLVRLAYLTLPAGLDRHTRVLRAHRAVQQALRGAGRRAGDGGDPLAAVRGEVVRRAVGRPRPLPPWVWGLRMWPSGEGLDEAARALSGVGAYARAAHVLCRWDGLPEAGAAEVLELAGAPDPAQEVRAGLSVASDLPDGHRMDAALRPAEVHTRPTDLLLRRTRARAAGAAGAALALALGLALTQVAGDGRSASSSVPYAGSPVARAALDPARLLRAPARSWSDTGRVDFTAWPARGARTADRDLLSRALATWAAPTARTVVATAPATSAEGPMRPPQLLFAGDPEPGVAVVVLLDADRLVRYTERESGRGLDFARVDDANVTTAASLVLLRPDGDGPADGDGPGRRGTVRQLLAPWIVSAGVRDPAAPAAPVHPLPIGGDGTVTVPGAVPAAAPAAVPTQGQTRTHPGPAGCAPGPVLEVASSPRIVEKHAFLLADLGGLLPVHLTYTPLPAEGESARARQPREATGPVGRERWARELCVLREVDGRAVRAVNLWDFARAELPEAAGQAVWSCVRLTHWTGRGDVSVRLRPPTGEAIAVARVRATAACGRFGQHLLAATVWRAPSGRRYQLAAGSREIAEITAYGSLRAHSAGRAFTAPAAPTGATPPTLTARLHSGTTLTALDATGGGRE